MQNPNGVHNYFDHLQRQKQRDLVFDPITGYTKQTVTVTGQKLPNTNWAYEHDFWKSRYTQRTWDYEPSNITTPINIGQHLQSLVMSIITDDNPLRKSVPTAILSTGVDIFMDMMDRSGRGTPGLSDFPIP